MTFDVRLPIGILFSLLGAILVLFGLVSDPAIYRTHSLGLNINLAWGGALLVFGLVVLGLAAVSGRAAKRN